MKDNSDSVNLLTDGGAPIKVGATGVHGIARPSCSGDPCIAHRSSDIKGLEAWSGQPARWPAVPLIRSSGRLVESRPQCRASSRSLGGCPRHPVRVERAQGGLAARFVRSAVECRAKHIIHQRESALTDHSRKNAGRDQFKVQRADDAKKALSEYEADAAAVAAKTERLRALRLAKEAAEAKATPRKTAPPRKKAAKPSGEKSPSLADWLKDRQRAGWRD